MVYKIEGDVKSTFIIFVFNEMDDRALYWSGKQQKREGSDYLLRKGCLKWERLEYADK